MQTFTEEFASPSAAWKHQHGGIELGQAVNGIFMPQRTDDLRDEVRPWVGVQCRWRAAWIIESGQFAGDIAMQCLEFSPGQPPLGWVPLRDLVIVEG